MQEEDIHIQEAEEEAYMCLQEQAASQTEELQVEVCSHTLTYADVC